MIDVLSYLPAKRKQTPSGWVSFNAVCCHHTGQSQDRRQRGGLKQTDQGWSYHCFNCGFTASFILGRTVSIKAKKLLGWLGVPDNEIERLNLESLKHKNINGLILERQKTFDSLKGIHFDERELPERCDIITANDSEYWNYLQLRHVPNDYPCLKKASDSGRPGIIIPFTYNHTMVGWTTRFLDDRNPRYISDSQPGYVFGLDQQLNDWVYVIVTEGIFDALSINGLALMHNDISETQARLIRSLGREVVIVPDQDRAGLELIKKAEEFGFAVSIPEWDLKVKDINDAVIKYGQLPTLLSIIENKERNSVKIKLKTQWLKNKIKHGLSRT